MESFCLLSAGGFGLNDIPRQNRRKYRKLYCVWNFLTNLPMQDVLHTLHIDVIPEIMR